ncbi:MAG: hypothetical protein QM736_10790 [Vicinamibacterales bacterium]
MTDCYPGIDDTPMFEVLRRVMHSRQPEQCLSEFTYPDGAHTWFELLMQPVADGVCIISLDVNDRQRAQAQLRQAPTIEALAPTRISMAYDFGNVLSAMTGFCDLHDGCRG